jgi:hypothetical protein
MPDLPSYQQLVQTGAISPYKQVTSGTAQLTLGTCVVPCTAVLATSLVFLSYGQPAGTQGFLSAPSNLFNTGSSFTVNSSSVADSSTFYWYVMNS